MSVALELIILIGLQASGKSTFRAERFGPTYVVVSKDNFRRNRRPERRQRFLIQEALSTGRSVVVDNTNVRAEDRIALVEQGKKYSASVAGYFFSPNVPESLRRNALRLGRAKVPEVAIKTMAKEFVPPSLNEGFDMLYEVTLSPTGFDVRHHAGDIP